MRIRIHVIARPNESVPDDAVERALRNLDWKLVLEGDRVSSHVENTHGRRIGTVSVKKDWETSK